jgi:hypothetical protein
MHARKTVLAAAFLTITAAGLAGAHAAGRHAAAERAESTGRRLGFELQETKEELKLQYDVAVQDNGGGRMYVTFTLADEGRIKPLFAVDLAVPSKDGSGYYDVVVPLAPYEKDGKKIYTLQLTRDLVERGEIDLKTTQLDGKRIFDWGYHRVPFAPYVKEMDKKAAEKKSGEAAPATPPAPAATPAVEQKKP